MKVEKSRKKRKRSLGVGIVLGSLMCLQIVGAQTAKPKENLQQVEQVNIITPQKIQFEGQELDLKGTSIKLIGPRGAAYEAKYQEQEKVYELTKDELGIGVPYTVRADFAVIPKAYETISIPCVLEVKLTEPNQLEIIFDTIVDIDSATKAENYWVRTSEVKASGIATLGKEEEVTANNALKASEVMIKPKDATHKVMVMTFNEEASPGVTYSLVPCFINKACLKGYRGGNFIAASRLDFKVR